MSIAAPFYWDGPTPSIWQIVGICSLGFYGGVGHLLLTRAFRHGPASTLSPILYVQLGWATMVGWLLYDHLPRASCPLGA